VTDAETFASEGVAGWVGLAVGDGFGCYEVWGGGEAEDVEPTGDERERA